MGAHTHAQPPMAARANPRAVPSPPEYANTLALLVDREPMLQYGIDLLNSLCLGEGVKISVLFQKPSAEFQSFFNEYFVSSLRNIVKYKLYCGFLPFCLRKVPGSGDKIPVVLPLGSFVWSVRVKEGVRKNNTTRNAEESRNKNYDHGSLCEYFVTATGTLDVKSEEIWVVNLLEPTLIDHSPQSGIVQLSPLFLTVKRYIELETARQRLSYADDWNTTARLFTVKRPPQVLNERAGKDEVPFGTSRFQQAMMPEGFFTYDNMRVQYHNAADLVRDALEHNDVASGAAHVPAVYALPTHFDLLNSPQLHPLQNVENLEREYRASVAHVLGIPQQLLDVDSGRAKGIGKDELPLLSELMRGVCRELTGLMYKSLMHQYSAVYYPGQAAVHKKVRFAFNPRNLYSEEMQEREDEMIRLQKQPLGNDASSNAQSNKKAKSS
jgi:hypothetical protein